MFYGCLGNSPCRLDTTRSAGNLIKITDNNGNSINYSYDTKGNRIKEEIKDTSGNLQKTVSYQYDLPNQLTRIDNPDGGYTLYGYDSRGNRVTAKNPNGNVASYIYDSLNRLIKIIQPGNIVTTYTYDKRGNLTSVTDANGNTTTYEYNLQNGQIKTISPDTGTTTYTYDLNGNLKTKTDAEGITITYSYDIANRLLQISFPDTTQNITYTYDNCTNGKGRLCKMTDPAGTTNYEYNAKGQIVKETKIIDNITYVTEYSYNKNGKLTSMKYPGERVITYNYSNDRAISILNNAVTVASDITYKPFGGMTDITYGNGITGTINYDNQYRITALTAGTILNYSYTHDYNGNITGITNNLDTANNKTYTYDVLDSLTEAIGPWGSLNYTYDGVGNRQKETSNLNETNYTYTANKLISSSGEKMFTFSYDATGNTTTENTRQYIYNQNQRLIKVTENDTDTVILGEYIYNGNGQRVKKVAGGTTTIFHYSLDGQLIAESDNTGAVTADYVYLFNQPLAKIENNDIYYYHNDHLATPMLMTDESGQTVWEGEYLPFGEQLSVTGSITNNLRFPGQYYDSETGLHYNYYRDYKPEIGRYLEADPIGIDNGRNHLFVYVGNNPVNFVDPEGLSITGLWRALQAARALIPKIIVQLRKAYKTCKNIRCKIKIEGPHHPFPGKGWCKHVRVTCWIKGKKGSKIEKQIPYGKCFKKKPK